MVVLDDLSTGCRENFAAARRRISFIRGSVADLSTCRRAMEGVDYVLHHAAVTSVQRSVDDPVAAYSVNATGTLNALIAARDARVRRAVCMPGPRVWDRVFGGCTFREPPVAGVDLHAVGGLQTGRN